MVIVRILSLLTCHPPPRPLLLPDHASLFLVLYVTNSGRLLQKHAPITRCDHTCSAIYETLCDRFIAAFLFLLLMLSRHLPHLPHLPAHLLLVPLIIYLHFSRRFIELLTKLSESDKERKQNKKQRPCVCLF